MNNRNGKKSTFRTYLMYGAFGVAVVFAISVLVNWILQDIVQLVPMAILIGILTAVAVKLFSDAVKREHKGG